MKSKLEKKEICSKALKEIPPPSVVIIDDNNMISTPKNTSLPH